MCQTHRSPFLPTTKGHNWDIWTLSLDFKRFLRALQIKEEYFLTESFYALQIFVSNIFLSHMSTWHVSAWWDSPTDCALAVVMVGTRSHHIPAKWHRGGALVLHCIYAGHCVPPSPVVMWSNWSLTPLRTNNIVTRARVKLTPRKQNLRLTSALAFIITG